MPDAYPGGVTKEQYIAVLRDATVIMCEACGLDLPMVDEFQHSGERFGKDPIDCEAWKIRSVLADLLDDPA